MGQVIGILLSGNIVACKQSSWQLNSGLVKEPAMDPQKVKEILDFKLENIYPPNFTKNQCYVLKQRAESYQLINKANHTTALYPLRY